MLNFKSFLQCSGHRLQHAPLLKIGRRCLSVRPESTTLEKQAVDSQRKKMTIQRLKQMRNSGSPIVMLTAYDFPTARACDANDVDVVLVGDSLAQVCLGYDSTTQLTMDEMLSHCRAVARGVRYPFLVADMPFGSYHAGEDDAVRNAVRLVREGRVEAVKLEGGEEIVSTVKRLTGMGIPVMAHVGLLPQRHISSSGYRVQGKDAISAQNIYRSAVALQNAGAFSMVLEAIPHSVASYITERLHIPTIGIGAGSGTNGQVLVWDDAMGTWNGHRAKFVRRFADAKSEVQKGITEYCDAVRRKTFPGPDESYNIDSGEWQRFLELEHLDLNVENGSIN